MDMILEIKVLQFSKNVSNKKHDPIMISFNEKKIRRKIRIIFDIKTLKVRNHQFLIT